MSPSSLTSPPDAVVGAVTAGEPYKFLDFFEERDRESFAGRDRDIQECLDRITTLRVFVLYAVVWDMARPHCSRPGSSRGFGSKVCGRFTFARSRTPLATCNPPSRPAR